MLGYEFQHDSAERIDLSFSGTPHQLLFADDFALPSWWPGLLALHRGAAGPLRYGPPCWLEFDQSAASAGLAGVFLQVDMDGEAISHQAFLDHLAADLAGLDPGLAQLNQHTDLRLLLECADLPHFVGQMSGRDQQPLRLVCLLSHAEMLRTFAERFSQLCGSGPLAPLVECLHPLLKGSHIAVSFDYDLRAARFQPRIGFEVLPLPESLNPAGVAAILDQLALLVPEKVQQARRVALSDSPGLTLSHFKIVSEAEGQLTLKTYVLATEQLPMVYALGTLAYDFPSVARLDSFRVGMGGGEAAPFDVAAMTKYLLAHPAESSKLVWTLCVDSLPIYALQAEGADAADTYSLLVQLLSAERISVPARRTDASARLLSGSLLPVLRIDHPRGLFGWRTEELVAKLTDDPLQQEALQAFLVRVYHDLRNLGDTAAQRALNYAATSAAQAAAVFQDVVAREMQLENIEVAPSASCRLHSDCWDVKLKFFDPENSRRARLIYRFSVDVAELLPVALGPPKRWSVSG